MRLPHGIVSEFMAIFLAVILGLTLGFLININEPCNCPETLPTTSTDMFTIQGDTIYLKQDADFVISTRGIVVDTAGLIHRK